MSDDQSDAGTLNGRVVRDTDLACAAAGSAYPIDQPQAPNLFRRLELRIAVGTALEGCTTTAGRCFMAGVPWPPEWVAYRAALVAMVNALAGPDCDPAALTMPVRPAYPVGS